MFDWKLFNTTLEGKALILGPGFDYKMMISFNEDGNILIRYQRPFKRKRRKLSI